MFAAQMRRRTSATVCLVSVSKVARNVSSKTLPYLVEGYYKTALQFQIGFIILGNHERKRVDMQHLTKIKYYTTKLNSF